MKTHKKFIWQLYPLFLLVTIISLVAVTLYTTRSVREYFLNQIQKDLNTQGILLRKQLMPYLAPLSISSVESFCQSSVRDTDIRLTVILPNGLVIGDSNENPGLMDNHKNRPEIAAAMEGGLGSSIRYSTTVQQNMMYVAIPVTINNATAAVIRTAVSINSIEQELNTIQMDIAVAGVLTAILASIVCWWLARRISKPMEKMKQGADRFAGGDLNYRLEMPGTLEMAVLAESMNRMAEQLDNRMEAIINQRNEYEAVLASMTEGVLAVDLEERVMSINQAAAKMLNVESADLKKTHIQEIIRHPKLNGYVSHTLGSGKISEGDILIETAEKNLTLNVRSTPLHNASEERIGALVVLIDVTRLRNLETVRQDFVANVSHELRTPLTAIQGFVETLLGKSAPKNKEEAERFLRIIDKHVQRLNAIIEDLLSLSNIEQFDEESGPKFSPQLIKPIIDSALQTLQTVSNNKQINYAVEVDDKYRVGFDAGLMEQALLNLLENAVNFSPEGGRIDIISEIIKSEYVIRIKDEGPGIQQKHLPRLFERFYRADKARSREFGGTGLGLAIVKHIVQYHSGRITVDTDIGKGSTFSIFLPLG